MRFATKACLTVVAGALACLASLQPLNAADLENVGMPAEPERSWAVIVSPYIWGAALNGNASLAGFNTDVDVPFSDTLKNLDLAIMGNIEVTNGQWGGYIDGQYVRLSQDEELLAHQIGVKFTMTTISAGLFYRVYEKQLGGNTVFGEPRLFAVEPTVGLRWNKLKADVDVAGFSASRDADWTDPFVGLRFNADLTDRWNFISEADIGGFGAGSKISVNAQAYFGYRTFLFKQPTIIRAGYRVFYQDYENDDFTGSNKFRWNVTEHGPVIGLSMRF